jgi:excisionase family DNA binding protein
VQKNGIIEINGKRFVTVDTLSEIFRLNKRTIQHWAAEKDLPLIRVGNLMIFDLDDVTQWLMRHKRQRAT